MTASVCVQAPAKVNLHLRVYGRRPDGFHGILSLFQALSLSDSIVVRSLKKPDAVEIGGIFDCPPEKTTLFKAAVAFREATGLRDGVSIVAEKRVPAGAGLGGGSGDAAAVLRALNALFDTSLSGTELARLGSLVGSDVPFFFSCGAAIVSGRGDVVEGIPCRDDFSLVVVFPGFSVGTAWAYSLLDRERAEGSLEPDPGKAEIEAMYRGPTRAWRFGNSFEPFVGALHSAIPALTSRLLSEGASFAAMSGSGSSVFGVFDDPEMAHAVMRGLCEDGFSAFAAQPLARPPTLD